MNEKDKEWLQRCINKPNIYKIVVDNDCQWIESEDSEGEIVTIDLCPNRYGWEFAIELLKYMGCNAESV